MTIVCYQPLMAVLALGRMVSFINIGHSSYNEFPSDYLSKPSFSLCYIQHHSLCEYHHNETGFVNDLWLTYQQPTSELSSLSLTCQRNTTCNLYCFQMTLKLHLPTHSLCFLDTIIPPNQHHSTEYSIQSCIDIIIISPICNWNPTWQYSLYPINTHFLFPFHMISNPLIQTHSHSQPSKHTPTASILTTLCNPWFQITLAVIQPIRWIHDTHNVQDMLHWRWWDQNQLSFHRR